MKKVTKKQKEKRAIAQLELQVMTLDRSLMQARSKIGALEKELVSALEEHGRALTQRNHAESVTQSFYDALRKILRVIRA